MAHSPLCHFPGIARGARSALTLCAVGAVLLLSSACSDAARETPSQGLDAAHRADSGPRDAATRDTGPAGDAARDASPRDGGEALPERPVEPRAEYARQAGIDGNPDVGAPLGEGEVRAGRILSADTGFSGIWSHCRAGDFKLYNGRVEVCIQQESTNRYETFYGGQLVDARRVGQPGEDVLDMVMPLVGFGTTSAERVEVVRDGSQPGPAVVRVTGRDTELAHLMGALGRGLGTPLGLAITTEYRLAPDSDTVEMVTWFENRADRTRSFAYGDWYAWGDRTRLWRPSHGLQSSQGPQGWLGAQGQGFSHGWVFSGEASVLSVPSESLPWMGMRVENVQLPRGREVSYQRHFVVGDGTLESVRRRALEIRGELPAGQEHTIEVQEDGQGPVVGAGVLVRQAGKPVAWDITDVRGQVRLWLPEASDYELTIDGLPSGDTRQMSMAVHASNEPTRIAVGPYRPVRLAVVDSAGEATLSARVVLRKPGYQEAFFALNGALELRLVPGTYEASVTRGMEFDVTTLTLEVPPGPGSVERTVELRHSVDTTGWLSGDFHQHMEPSIDSEVAVRDRLYDNATQGVEIVVPTDHEVVTDLMPYIVEAGLVGQLTSLPGVEISPAYAHMNLFPMPYRPDLRGRGTLELAALEDGQPVVRRIPQLVAMARALDTQPVVQINHGRSSSGLLRHVGYNPELGPQAVVHRDFTTDIDAMEIINRPGDVCSLLADWSGFLNAGMRVAGLGNSDTHGLSAEAGVPRNFLAIDTPVGEVTGAMVTQAIRAQRVSVGAHAFIDFGGGLMPGDTISLGPMEVANFEVRVQTPNWSEADRLFAIVNGRVEQVWERQSSNAAEVDFLTAVQLVLARDSWVVFLATGPEPRGAVSYGMPVLAFTNPVYVDVDGDRDMDGQSWEAPGPGPLDLGPVLARGFCD